MREIVEEALALWAISSTSFELVAARENHVFRVDEPEQSYALRLHRPHYRTDLELRSELQWMNAVTHSGLHVPTPVAAVSGDLVHTVQGVQVDILSWLPGVPIGSATSGLAVDDRTDLFHEIGCEMASLHQASDDWTSPKDFTRPSWNRDGLVGEKPVWGRFWENLTLSREDNELLRELRHVGEIELYEAEKILDYGLIHADLVRENIMRDGSRIQFIDFDDGGFGFRLFDLATTLMPNLNEPDYQELKSALLKGYRSVRTIDTSHLNLFMALRSATYLGWIMTRMDEKGSVARNERFIKRTRKLAQEYLANNSA